MERYNLEIIDEIAQIDPADNFAFFRSQVSKFKEYSREQMVLFEQASESGDRSAVVNYAHALGGAAANFGAACLASHLKKIERSGKEMEPSELNENVEQLRQEFVIFCDFLDQYITGLK